MNAELLRLCNAAILNTAPDAAEQLIDYAARCREMPAPTAFPAELLRLCNDAVLCSTANAADLLIDYATKHKQTAATTAAGAATTADAWRTQSVDQRLRTAVVKGIADYLAPDIADALQSYSALQIIEDILMSGISEVGVRFGDGRMFLPQVVKSARILRTAVNILEPHLKYSADTGSNSTRKKVVLATVKGDVHDIGKNIVSIVLACNGFEIVDLGVMTPAERILDAIRTHRPDLIGLSGLITPSLDEMKHVAEQLNEMGCTTPLLVGGAATTALHTALHLDEAYPHRIFHVPDASQAPDIARRLTTTALKHHCTSQQQRRNEELRRLHAAARRSPISLEEARKNRMQIDWTSEASRTIPCGTNVTARVPVHELIRFVDWSMFFYSWGFKGKHPDILTHPKYGDAVSQLYAEAQDMLRRLDSEDSLLVQSTWCFYAAASEDEDIVFYNEERSSVLTRIRTARQLYAMQDGSPNLSLADFVAPLHSGVRDCVGLFALTVQPADSSLLNNYRTAGNEYDALLVETLCHRLAEACALHLMERLPVPCLRYAVGYSSLPDHSIKRIVFDLLGAEASIGASLTDSYMIVPPASECGLLLPNPQARYF